MRTTGTRQGSTRAHKVYEFKRGRSVKKSLGLGIDGYYIKKPGRWSYSWAFADGIGWDRKVTDLNQIHPTEYTGGEYSQRLAEEIKKLPVVVFKHTFTRDDEPGFFGDWHGYDQDDEAAQLSQGLFVAVVQDAGNRVFLVDPQGYCYPRYVTELVGFDLT